MTQEEMTVIASMAADMIRSEHVIPATYSSEIGKYLRESTYNSGWKYRMTVPLSGGNGFLIDLTITSSGAIILELCLMSGERFWQGTLEPAKPVDKPDMMP